MFTHHYDTISFDTIFDSFLGKPTHTVDRSDEGTILKLAVPGYEKDEIDIDVSGGVISISSEAKDKDFPIGIRKFKLNGLNAEEVSAKLTNGILSITFGKSNRKTTKVDID